MLDRTCSEEDAMKDADIWRNVASEILTKGRMDLIDEYFAPNYVDHEPPPPGITPDREGVRTVLASMKEAFPDLKVDIVHQSQDGDTHYSHVRCSFFFNDAATTETYTLSLPAALPIPLLEDLLGA